MTALHAGRWRSDSARQSASDALHAAVVGLIRARRAQHILEHLWCGTLVALVLAAVAVLSIRVGQLHASISICIAAILVAGALVSAIVALLRWPPALQTAISADLKLKLKQQLSTAWEFAETGADTELNDRLAAQAVRARLPSRPELVFPLRLNTWGRLIPAAALLLVLVGIVEMPSSQQRTQPIDDPLLSSEGTRLREYAQAMQARAQAHELARSEKQAKQMRQLGARMESGGLSRRQALSRLREMGTALDAQQQAALAQGAQTRIDNMQFESVPSPPAPRVGGLSPRQLLDRLLDGGLEPGDLRALGDDPNALERYGISADELQQALQAYSEGEQQKLRELLQQLNRLEQSGRDANELRAARERVQQARENLGESDTQASAGDAGNEAGNGEGEDDFGDLQDVGPMGNSDIDDGVSASLPGAGSQSRSTPRAPSAARSPESESTGELLRPESQLGKGDVFVSEARVLPRATAPSVEVTAVDARFESQLEAVLSKEDVPLRQKTFIQRYFLNLSEGSEDQAR